MIIKGIQKTSLVDYEPYTVSTIFTGGCNFRCPFCHNPSLVKGFDKLPDIKEDEVIDFLVSRKNWLDGICITGGEPLLHKDLPAFVKKVKDKLGAEFKVKIDTNGTNPELLKQMIDSGIVDYIAMDYKAPIDKYETVIGVKTDIGKIKESLELIRNSKVDYEFRTTILPRLHSKEDIVQMAKELKGVKRYFLQNFKIGPDLLDADFKNEGEFNPQELEELKKLCSEFVETGVRN